MAIQPDDNLLCFEYVLRKGLVLDEALMLVGAGGEKLIDFWRLDGRIGSNPQFSLHLAYEELASNVARHSLARSEKDISLRCESRIGCGDVSLSIYDDGPPFDPMAGGRLDNSPDAFGVGSPPGFGERVGGMGLVLVRKLFPGMVYEYVNRRNGVHIVLQLP